MDKGNLLELYQSILDRTSKWPPNFWYTCSETLEQAAVVTQYLFEETLCISKEMLPFNAQRQKFVKYGLGSMLEVVFHNKPRVALKNAFPDHIYLDAKDDELYRDIIKKYSNENELLGEVAESNDGGYWLAKQSLTERDFQIIKMYRSFIKDKWPREFWKNVDDPFYVAKTLTRYVFFEKDERDIRNIKVPSTILYDHRLEHMERTLFDGHYQYAIQNAFPEIYYSQDEDMKFAVWFQQKAESLTNYDHDKHYCPIAEIEARYFTPTEKSHVSETHNKCEPHKVQDNGEVVYYRSESIIRNDRAVILRHLDKALQNLSWIGNGLVKLLIENETITIKKEDERK